MSSARRTGSGWISSSSSANCRCGSSICLPTDVDAAIQEAQRRIVEALDFDRSALFQLSDDGDLLHTHSWWRPDVPAPPARMSARESFPWMLEKLRAGELVCLSSPDELPDGVDRASLLRFDMKSTVAVPLSVARRIVGVVTFAVTRRERQWPAGDSSARAPRGEHVRQRARPPAQRRGAPPGARRGEAPERSAARGERVPAPRSREHARYVGRRRAERRDSPGAGAGAPGGRRPTRRSSSSARPAPARSCSPRRFTS